jgi:translation initiation factor IF-3
VPPVCKILDYGRFKYELAKSQVKQTVLAVKEMKFRPKTDDHDVDFKVKHIREFILEGHKARLLIQFRGREIVHPEVGRDVLRRVVEACTDIAQVEQQPMMEGRRMLMIIGPKAGVVKRQEKEKPVRQPPPAQPTAAATGTPPATGTAPATTAPATTPVPTPPANPSTPSR